MQRLPSAAKATHVHAEQASHGEDYHGCWHEEGTHLLDAAQMAKHSQQGAACLVRPQHVGVLHVSLREPVMPFDALLALQVSIRKSDYKQSLSML